MPKREICYRLKEAQVVIGAFPSRLIVGFNREIMAIMQIDYGAAHRPHHGWVGVRSQTAALARVVVNSTKPIDRSIPACCCCSEIGRGSTLLLEARKPALDLGERTNAP